MRTIIYTVTIGYGQHTDTMEVEDDATDKEIEVQVEQQALQWLDWSWREVK